jgi:hypothetical protein
VTATLAPLIKLKNIYWKYKLCRRGEEKIVIEIYILFQFPQGGIHKMKEGVVPNLLAAELLSRTAVP